jgi:medium-chain acyl-[acyl-carrier-protein] hydrolase
MAGYDIWEQKYKISNFQIDPFGKLKTSALFELFQQAASDDANRRGFGFHDLMPQNKLWVLIRTLMRIKQLPRWDDQIVFRTWPKDHAGIIAFRDFEILNDAGKQIIAGTSSWSQLDLKSRRPVRINLDEFAQSREDMVAIAERAGKVAVSHDYIWSDPVGVRNSHIDVQWHVNNTRYLEWVYNELPLKEMKDMELSEVSVNFLGEGKLNDRVVCGIAQLAEDCWNAAIKRQADDKLLFAAQLNYNMTKQG